MFVIFVIVLLFMVPLNFVYVFSYYFEVYFILFSYLFSFNLLILHLHRGTPV